MVMVFLYYFGLNSVNKKQSQLSISLTPTPSLSSQQISLPQGSIYPISEIHMKNFYQFAQEIKSDGEVIIEENENYRIMYFPEREYFLISILSSPFSDVRKGAEESFLQILGLNRENACKLNLSITTPIFVNPNEAGTDYHLSFCKE